MMKTFLTLGFCLFSIKSYSAINKNQKYLLDKTITIAVIDTGLDLKHREFKNFIWTNSGESGLDQNGQDKSTNNKDDDDNGFVDDIHGWNFINNSNDLLDSMGHGTHISGIIKNESSKSPFTKNKIKLMVLKYYDANSSDGDNIENTVKAINYAVQMGADIINYSGGGSLPSLKEMKAIERANEQKIIFVAAAGNNRSNTDINKYFPANYSLDNIIAVAASDENGDLVNFSNYGSKSVDLVAPGKQILSALPNNLYGFMSGTSQATAFVTGNVALELLKIKNKISPMNLKQNLFKLAEYNKALVGKTKNQLALKSSALN